MTSPPKLAANVETALVESPTKSTAEGESRHEDATAPRSAEASSESRPNLPLDGPRGALGAGGTLLTDSLPEKVGAMAGPEITAPASGGDDNAKAASEAAGAGTPDVAREGNQEKSKDSQAETDPDAEPMQVDKPEVEADAMESRKRHIAETLEFLKAQVPAGVDDVAKKMLEKDWLELLECWSKFEDVLGHPDGEVSNKFLERCTGTETNHR